MTTPVWRERMRLRPAIRYELRRVLSPPYEAPVVVVFNGLLMAGAWFFLPPDLLFRFHGARVFPLILASWMYADVPATNVLGTDATHMATLLDDDAGLRRALAARAIVLWSLVTPTCVVVAILNGTRHHESGTAVAATIGILATVPLGALAIAQWLGILFPYHAIPLAVRWQHRREVRRMGVRWGALVLLPYVWVPTLSALLVSPALLFWHVAGTSWSGASDALLLVGLVVLVALAVLAWRVGLAGSLRLVHRRRDNLQRILTDPLSG